MSVVDILLETARQDTDLLIKNDERGDIFTIPRAVDFLITVSTVEKADIICSFITDNRYGNARVEQFDQLYRILITVHMPITQNVLCSVSGLMACIAALFGATYDGWGCTIQTTEQ